MANLKQNIIEILNKLINKIYKYFFHLPYQLPHKSTYEFNLRQPIHLPTPPTQQHWEWPAKLNEPKNENQLFCWIANTQDLTI